MLLAIGSSHLTAFLTGYHKYRQSHGEPFSLQAVRLASQRYKDLRGSDPSALHDAMRHDIATILRAHNVRGVVSCIGGAVHNVIGLVNDPRPFDLLLPDATTDDTLPGADVLPYDLVAASMRHHMSGHIVLMRILRESVGDRPIFQLSPPQPIADAAEVRARPASFAEAIAERGVAPASLRWKLWRAACLVLAEECAPLAIRLLDVPAGSRDAAGFLREDCRGNDPTHGNDLFGLLQVEQLVHEFGGVPA